MLANYPCLDNIVVLHMNNSRLYSKSLKNVFIRDNLKFYSLIISPHTVIVQCGIVMIYKIQLVKFQWMALLLCIQLVP